MTARERREAIRKRGPFNLFDIIFFGIAIALAIVLTVLMLRRGSGKSVTVSSPSGSATYSLETNAEIVIDDYLTLVIENGEAYVKDAKCPDKLCERTGKVSREGAVIACLPGGIIITVSGESDFVEVGR